MQLTLCIDALLAHVYVRYVIKKVHWEKQVFIMSQCFIHANLVPIGPLVISCTHCQDTSRRRGQRRKDPH